MVDGRRDPRTASETDASSHWANRLVFARLFFLPGGRATPRRAARRRPGPHPGRRARGLRTARISALRGVWTLSTNSTTSTR